MCLLRKERLHFACINVLLRICLLGKRTEREKRIRKSTDKRKRKENALPGDDGPVARRDTEGSSPILDDLDENDHFGGGH